MCIPPRQLVGAEGNDGAMQLFVREAGELRRPLLVFIHGGGVSGWMWERQVEYFQERYHVLVPDLPGHGRSMQLSFLSIHQHARELIQLVKSRRAEGQPVFLIGFSLGAQIVMEMLSHAEKGMISGAVIISGLSRPVRGMTLPVLKPIIRLSMPITRYRWFAKLQAKELYIPEEQFEAYYNDSKHVTTSNLISVIDSSLSYELPESFARHTVNTLVLIGAKEKRDLHHSAAVLTSRNASCTGYRFEGVGHGISLAQPDVFNMLLESWLQDQELLPGFPQLERIS